MAQLNKFNMGTSSEGTHCTDEISNTLARIITGGIQ
jgi:hypothetical protein